jgi:hypothetical protein
MMFDEKKAMQDAIAAIARLNFFQLLVIQNNLSEHILNCYNYSVLQAQQKETEH